ncbi:unnamed protein product [Closterium sp. Yama58-4]|nr:unnamed protein product [Closterium sp. Yama58-4]
MKKDPPLLMVALSPLPLSSPRSRLCLSAIRSRGDEEGSAAHCGANAVGTGGAARKQPRECRTVLFSSHLIPPLVPSFRYPCSFLLSSHPSPCAFFQIPMVAYAATDPTLTVSTERQSSLLTCFSIPLSSFLLSSHPSPCAFFQIPMVAYAATDPTLTVSTERQFVMRTTHSDAAEMQAIADIIRHHEEDRWMEVVTIYIDNRFGRNGIVALESALQNKGSKARISRAIPLDITWTVADVKEKLLPLVEREESTVVVVHDAGGQDTGRVFIAELLPLVEQGESTVVVVHDAGGQDRGRVFIAAMELGLLTAPYAWIATEATWTVVISGDETLAPVRKAMECGAVRCGAVRCGAVWLAVHRKGALEQRGSQAVPGGREKVRACVVNSMGVCVVNSMGVCVVNSMGVCVVNSMGVCVVNSMGVCVVNSMGVFVVNSMGVCVVNSMGVCVVNSMGLASFNKLWNSVDPKQYPGAREKGHVNTTSSIGGSGSGGGEAALQERRDGVAVGDWPQLPLASPLRHQRSTISSMSGAGSDGEQAALPESVIGHNSISRLLTGTNVRPSPPLLSPTLLTFSPYSNPSLPFPLPSSPSPPSPFPPSPRKRHCSSRGAVEDGNKRGHSRKKLLPLTLPPSCSPLLLPPSHLPSPLSDGAALREVLLKTEINGVTGRLNLLPNGDRDKSDLEVINVVNGTARVVAYWQSSRGLLSNTKAPWGYLPKKKLRLAVPVKMGFHQFSSIASSTTGSESDQAAVGGFPVAVFRAIAAHLKYPLRYEFVPFGNGAVNPSYDEMLQAVADKLVPFGNGSSNPSYDEMLQAVADKFALFGNGSSNPSYDEMLQAVADKFVLFGNGSSNPSYDEMLQAMAAKVGVLESSSLAMVTLAPEDSNPWTPLVPFSPSMWLWLAIAALLFALTILFLERLNSSLFLQHPVEGDTKAARCRSKAFSFLQDLWEALWIAFQSYFLVPVEVHTLLARVPVLVWYGLVLILSTSYTANLTSIYTVNLLTPPLQVSVGCPSLECFSLPLQSLLSASRPMGGAVDFVSESYFLVPVEVHTLLARVPVLVWYGLVLILSTSYTANLTSIYTVNLLTPPLQVWYGLVWYGVVLALVLILSTSYTANLTSIYTVNLLTPPLHVWYGLVWYGVVLALVLILSTSYTANLTSIYTVNLLTPPLQVGTACPLSVLFGLAGWCDGMLPLVWWYAHPQHLVYGQPDFYLHRAHSSAAVFWYALSAADSEHLACSQPHLFLHRQPPHSSLPGAQWLSLECSLWNGWLVFWYALSAADSEHLACSQPHLFLHRQPPHSSLPGAQWLSLECSLWNGWLVFWYALSAADSEHLACSQPHLFLHRQPPHSSLPGAQWLSLECSLWNVFWYALSAADSEHLACSQPHLFLHRQPPHSSLPGAQWLSLECSLWNGWLVFWYALSAADSEHLACSQPHLFLHRQPPHSSLPGAQWLSLECSLWNGWLVFWYALSAADSEHLACSQPHLFLQHR